MSARVVALALGLVVGSAGSAVAQQDTLHLTLSRALTLAQANNPAYRQKENTAHAAGAAVRSGWAAFLPSVTASMNLGGNAFTSVTGQDFYGRPVQLDTPATYQSSSVNQSIGLNLTLFNGFQNLNNAHVASAQRDADVAGVDVQGAQLAADVKTDFYMALLNERLIAVEEQLLKSTRDQLAATQKRFENASADQSDVLGAQVAVAQQEANVAQQRGAAEKSLLTLRQAIGLSDTLPIAVTGDFPAAFDPGTSDTTGLFARALNDNPTLAQSIAAARAAHASAAVQHGKWWPTIQANASYTRSMTLNSYKALTEFNPQNHGFSFGLYVSLPIFNQFQTSQQVAQANAQSANADEALRQQRLTVQTEVRSAFIDLENAYQQSQLADRSADLARRRLNLSRQKYLAGSVNFTELEQIVNQEANAERTALRARATFATSLAALEQKVGGKVGP
ncbi:MAG TPA: TolC family protein [Gemmatimonadales bacterium]|nr:TolC family protein [Gemmatimonadales bacterium]